MPYCLGTLARKEKDAVTSYVWVFDLGHLLRGTPSVITPHRQVIVLRQGATCIGLLVSELHAVTAFSESRISPLPALQDSRKCVISQLIRANGGRLMVQCIDPQALMALLREPPPPEALGEYVPGDLGLEPADEDWEMEVRLRVRAE